MRKKAAKVVEYFEHQMKQHHAKQEAEIFEGIDGFKTFSEFCLKVLTPKTDYCILGVSSEVNDRFGSYLLKWQKRRAAKGIPLRIIYDADACLDRDIRGLCGNGNCAAETDSISYQKEGSCAIIFELFQPRMEAGKK